MPEDRSPPHETSVDAKSSSKHKWRGKLFSTEGIFGKSSGDVESTDDDVASFLQSSTTKPRARPQPAPRIDTAAAPRYSASAEDVEPTSVVDVYRAPKPRQYKGLRVAFVTAAPEIIGEGGDEAELPSREVSKFLGITGQPGQNQAVGLHSSIDDDQPRRGRDPSPLPSDDSAFEPKLLQRAPTGLSEIFDDKQSDNSEEELELRSRSFSASPLSKLKPLPQLPSRDHQNCDTEIGPRLGSPDVSPLTDTESDSDGDSIPQPRGVAYDKRSDHLHVPSSEMLVVNSITPEPSPQSRSIDSGIGPSSYGFPILTRDAHAPPEAPVVRSRVDGEGTSAQLPVPKSKAFSLRQVAKGLGDDSLDDFDARVGRFNNIFRLGVSAQTDLMGVPFVRWIRAACWWFLKGRQGLESEVRSKPDAPSDAHSSPNLKQAYVNLAKSWWIVKEITPNHPEITRFGKASMNSLCAMIKSFGDSMLAELAEVHVHIVANMRALTMSMKRNGKLPPPDLEIQRLDLHVFLEHPILPPEIADLMLNNTVESSGKGKKGISEPFFPTPIGDTQRHFNFGRLFVEVFVPLGGPKQSLRIPCVLSVLRDRGQLGVQAAITNQDGQVNLIISDEADGALSWKSVQWQIQSHEISITIQAGFVPTFKLQVSFMEKDFKTLWGICDYTQRIRKDVSTRRDEDLIFERTLVNFRCDDAKHFPANPIPDCQLRLFERKIALPDKREERTVHNGFRLTVITPSSMKTLSMVNYELGRENPILFGIHRGKDGSRLVLRILPFSVKVSPTFAQPEDIDLFRHLLSGTFTIKEDRHFPSLQLQSLAVIAKSISVPTSQEESRGITTIPWNKLRVVHKGSSSRDHEIIPTGLESVQIFADSDIGTFADRMNLASGELQLGLSLENFNKVKFLRPARSDATWSLADDRVSREILNSICVVLKIMNSSSTVRTYCFRSLQDVHSFQTLVTGFSVLFDGVAGNFTISRRRMVMPVYKKREANSARLQVLRRDKVVQLIAFFEDCSHGACINFALKVTDVFETFEKGEWFCLRIVDAKFPLPKIADDESKDFVCLDMPEYPSEHDDITIGFHNGQGAYIDQDRHPSTIALHSDDDLNRITDVSPPIHLSTTFRYASNPDELRPAADCVDPSPTDAHVYSRETAPNTTRLETILTSLLHAPCLTYSSGLSALHAAYTFLNPSRISIGGGYHGSHGVLGIYRKLTGAKIMPLECGEEELQKGDVIHLETPVNPTGEAFEIRKFADKAHRRGAWLLIDATFGPPGLQDPFLWGADMVMHSGTKYLGGHSDMLCGVLATRNEQWIKGLREERVYLGSVMGSLEGWLGVRSLRTLEVRISRQSSNCEHLVQWMNGLASHERDDVGRLIEKVYHASLQNEDMVWLKKQMPNGFGPVFAFTMKDEAMAKQLPSKLHLFHHATSLGGVETLIEWRAMSDASVDRRLLRISVGLEHWEDLRDDLLQGFKSLLNEL
ncbi:hypothetical protein ACLMJK_008406 [Lecanora helva]